MNQATTRTLVVHSGGIGDFLLMCPAMVQLAAEGPVEILGRPERAALAVVGGMAERAHDIEAVGFESVFSEPVEKFRRFLAPFDRAIVWMRDDHGAIATAFQNCRVPDVRVFTGVPPDDWSEHASRYYLDQIGMKDVAPFRLDIAPGPVQRDVIIHPGSGSPKKNWPLANFQKLAQALETRGRKVTWCLGPAEEKLELPSGPDMLRCADLVALARELAAAKTYVGNDGGITHLAAAVGCAVTAIFGPTNPRVWAPRGRNVRIIHGAPSAISLAGFLSTLQ